MTPEIRPVEDKSVWLGSQIDYRQEGMHSLSGADVGEIDGALHHLKGHGTVDFSAISAQNFPLPKLGERLRALGEELRTGRGFLLLRGLPLDRWDADDLARIYVGLGVQIGKLLPQSYHGELLGHVIDVSDLEADARGYHAGGGQAFHTDTCDIISLMCVRGAKSGGLSRIASAAAVHNRLLETRPDLLEQLYGEYVCRRMQLDADRGSGVLVKKVAFFSRATGSFSCNVSGAYPRRAVAAGDTVMTPLQEEALVALQGLAASPEFHLDMAIGEGDIQFLNNRVIVHGRTAYEDWPEVARRRHLMRLWLEVAGWPAMPANQGMHNAADHRGWLTHRRPFMELPSRYMAEMTQRHKELVG